MQKITWKKEKEDIHVPWGVVGMFSAASLGIALYFFFSENYFATAFFGLSPIVFIALAAQGPREMHYELSEKHLRINNSRFDIKDFQYYSLLEGFLVFKPKRNEPAVYMPIPEDMIDEVESFLKGKLEEGYHEETFGEVINRILHLY